MATSTVRLRRGLATVAISAAAWAGPVESAAAATTYVVQPGDGFYAIAAATDADLQAILDANDLHLDSVIHPGQRLTIPGATSAPSTAAASPSPPTSSPTSSTVTVRAGDGLYAVARRADVSIQRLLAANGLTITSIIHPGQRLTIPGATSQPTAPAQATPASSSTVTVRAGEGLYAVAQRAGVSLQRLLAINGLSITSIIHPGQRLTIPDTSLPADVADRSLVGDFMRAASEAGVPADLLMAVCYRESRWQANAVSSAGAQGVCQLMLGTAAWVARDMIGEPDLDATNAQDNMRMGAHLLAWLLRRTDGDVERALAMYIQGVAGVEQNGISESSQEYVADITQLRRRFGRRPLPRSSPCGRPQERAAGRHWRPRRSSR